MDKLKRLIVSNTIFNRDRMHPVDSFGEIRVQNFVHLLDAAHGSGSLALLTKALRSAIQSTVDVSQYGAVFCPKLGNTVLGRSVAHALDLESGFVRNSSLMNRFVETRALPPCRVILVDDVSSEGRILTDCVRNAAEDGFVVDVAFTVVDRHEGDARRMLEAERVALTACETVDDALLLRMQNILRDVDGGD